MEEVEKIRKDVASGKNQMQYKKLLAFTLTRMLNSEAEAMKAQKYFEKTFQKKQISSEIPTFHIKTPELSAIDLLVVLKLVGSKSEAKRLIAEGAVELDGVKVTDPFKNSVLKNDMIVKVGKHRFVKLAINN